MEKKKLSVLIIDDSLDDAELIANELEQNGYDLFWQCIDTRECFLNLIDQYKWDLIISDFNNPGFNALEALDQINEIQLELPFIVVSGVIDEKTAISIMKAGADDFVMKDNLEKLLPVVKRELKDSQLRELYKKTEVEKRKFELELIKGQKRDTVAHFAGAASHDMRNLLSGIMGFASIIKIKYGGDPNLVKYGEIILKSAKKAVELSDRIFNMVRKDSKLKTTFDQVDIHVIIDGISRLINSSINDNVNSEIDLNAQKSIVFGSPLLLENAIMSIAINANEAMEKGGSIKIKTSNFKIEKDNGSLAIGEYIRIAIIDDGKGISETVKNHIFEPFYTTKENSIGMGLSGAKESIERHRGTIVFESLEYSGSEFAILLPLFVD